MMNEMRQRLEKYVDAIIKAEEAKFQRFLSNIAFIVLCLSALSTYIVVISNSPALTAFALFILYLSVGYRLNNKLKEKEEKAKRTQELLHPTEGEEGAYNAAKKAINDSMNAFGKKFLGLRRKDEIANDIDKDYECNSDGIK